ncbi:MAG: DUF3365 domain-containing protein [Gammaproteobacteria bacterium]|nr:MAG: DUF3365 domain-containing protein [Gammaproteobacteria bacterium]
MKRLLLFLVVYLPLWALADTATEAQQRQQGAALLLPFKTGLKAALQRGMAEGPDAAIAACRTEAPAMSAGLSVHGVRMGRSSLKLRNPVNAPEAWMQSVLADYAQSAGDWQPRLLPRPDGRLAYVEPIVLQPMCLVCHGESLPVAVSATLARLYPQDQATGYAVGDLRGIFWVEFDAAMISGDRE